MYAPLESSVRTYVQSAPRRTTVTNDGALFAPLSYAAHRVKPAPPKRARPVASVVALAHSTGAVFVSLSACDGYTSTRAPAAGAPFAMRCTRTAPPSGNHCANTPRSVSCTTPAATNGSCCCGSFARTP